MSKALCPGAPHLTPIAQRDRVPSVPQALAGSGALSSQVRVQPMQSTPFPCPFGRHCRQHTDPADSNSTLLGPSPAAPPAIRAPQLQRGAAQGPGSRSFHQISPQPVALAPSPLDGSALLHVPCCTLKTTAGMGSTSWSGFAAPLPSHHSASLITSQISSHPSSQGLLLGKPAPRHGV